MSDREVMRQVLNRARAALRSERVRLRELHVNADNTRGMAAYERAGFHQEGRTQVETLL